MNRYLSVVAGVALGCGCALRDGGYLDGPPAVTVDHGADHLVRRDAGVDRRPAPDLVGGTLDASAVDSGPAPQLDERHSGWKEAFCYDCHGQTTAFPHLRDGYREPRCVSCHGYNGAPHQDHAVAANPRCGECHFDVEHVARAGFSVPADCMSCHYQL